MTLSQTINPLNSEQTYKCNQIEVVGQDLRTDSRDNFYQNTPPAS